MLTKVMCTVDTCRYWRTGNLCKATEILVTGVGNITEGNPDTKTPATDAVQTACYTFSKK